MSAATEADRADRVKVVHGQARPTLVVAAGFAASAAGSAVVGSVAWLPLHLLLAGAVVATIAATTQLFTVTWSAAPAPDGRVVAGQRALHAGGVAALATGRTAGWTWLAAAGGAAFALSLVVLAVLLRTTVRRGAVRRFDTTAHAYVAACGFGLVGAGLGIAMVTGSAAVRSAHLTANVLGLVGLVVLATLPTFVPATARTKAGRLDARVVGLAAGAVATAVAGLVSEHPLVATAGLVAWVVALGLTVATLPRLGRKQLTWAGPRLWAVGAAVAWMSGSVLLAAARSATGDDPWPTPVLAALAVGGVLQLVWAALSYLVPVLVGGGHERLTASFAATRSPLGLAAANLTALALALASPLAVVTGVAWALDAARRLRLVLRPR